MASLLGRLGRFSARHRRPVVATWLAVLAVLATVAITGMKFSAGGFDVPGTDSSRAMQTLDEKFPSSGDGSDSLSLVIQSTDEAAPVASFESAIGTALDEVRSTPSVRGVADPFDSAQQSVSPDGTTAVARITTERMAEDELDATVGLLERDTDTLRSMGLTVEVGGIPDGMPELFGPAEVVGAVIAFVVLVITFGSLVAAGANMLGALLGLGVGVLGLLAFSTLAPIGTVTPVLAVMLGLAVGIDYCLFIISRFRTELRAGATVDDAIATATRTAGMSVVFAGATVVIALGGLLVVGIPFIAEMGLAAAFSVAVAVVMSLTLLPALMSWAGSRLLGRRAAQQPVDKPNRFFSAWANAVVRRPVLSLLLAVLALGTMALPALDMRTSLVFPGGEDPAATQRAAYDIVADKFGAGSQDPLVVLVTADGGDIAESTATVQDRIGSLDGVAAVFPAGVSADRTTAMLSVTAESGPLDDRTTDLVRDIRNLDVGDVEVAVTGSTAIALDSDEKLHMALIVYLAIIVGLSVLLLVTLFRSLLVPIIATLGFLLSLGAGMGATVAVFQWGWLDGIVAAPQGNPLLSLLPIITTGILFGLAMDYQVFLVSRIHEAHRSGQSPHEAIRSGFVQSGSVVTAAAAIMVAVFGGFALSPSSMMASIALALAAGVVADAFVVRMIIVPALLAIVGERAWWIPRWLDRVLPELDVEGNSAPEVDEKQKPRETQAVATD